MKRYAAFLRGVSPMNAKMPELKKAFEAAGFTDVRTVRAGGPRLPQPRQLREPLRGEPRGAGPADHGVEPGG